MTPPACCSIASTGRAAPYGSAVRDALKTADFPASLRQQPKILIIHKISEAHRHRPGPLRETDLQLHCESLSRKRAVSLPRQTGLSLPARGRQDGGPDLREPPLSRTDPMAKKTDCTS